METLLIGLKHKKAMQLLKDLEALDLIELMKNKDENYDAEKSGLSALKNSIVVKMNDAEIDSQLQSIRDEWQRNI